MPVSWFTPANFTYQLVCELALAVDDDVVSTSNGATGWDTGVGNLGFEAHFTPKFLGGGYDTQAKHCVEQDKPALTFDYVVTVPRPIDRREYGTCASGNGNIHRAFVGREYTRGRRRKRVWCNHRRLYHQRGSLL